MRTVVVDAMGGDVGISVNVEGSLLALKENDECKIILVGNEDEIKEELAKHKEAEEYKDRIDIVHSSSVVTMHDIPSTALKTKKDSSIGIGLNLVKEGKGHAFVSAGNTGAVMAFAMFILGRIRGISRPAIAAFFPGTHHPTLILDVGANMDCKPKHLYQFAVMGSLYVSHLRNIDEPTIGILSIGEESSKGNELTSTTYKLLEESKLNFVGNIEGNGLLESKADVVVTDGFVGNAILKFGEGIIHTMKQVITEHIKQSFTAKIGALLIKNALKKAVEDMNYEKYGGAPLLGLKGITIISHGKSTPVAIKNAITTAGQLAKKNFIEHIETTIHDLM